MDFRRFLVRSIQRIINNVGRLGDRVTVVGRSNNNYVIHFNDSRDQVFIWHHGPWSIDGALMAMDAWILNTILEEVNLPLIPIWVQIWGFPLEYQIPDIATRLAHTIGIMDQIDWIDVMPRNLKYMRIRVWINPKAPLIAGCMLQQDDGVMHWVEFRYENVYKVCRRCEIIGHTMPYCPHLNLDIERMIGEQMELIN